MAEFNLLPRARRALAEIIGISETRFGTLAADRYAAQLFQAMFDVADNPYRTGSKPFGDPDGTVRLYHIRHSKNRVPNPPGAAKRPRHLLVYEHAQPDTVDILGIIYDTIPPEQLVPELIEPR